MSNPNRFQALVADAKTRIREISAADAAREVEQGALLIDVREPDDWQESHVPEAGWVACGIAALKDRSLSPARCVGRGRYL